MSVSTTSSQLILMSALPQPIFRRTMSELVDRPCRKRSSDSVTESDRKRSRAVVIPLEDDVCSELVLVSVELISSFIIFRTWMTACFYLTTVRRTPPSVPCRRTRHAVSPELQVAVCSRWVSIMLTAPLSQK